MKPDEYMFWKEQFRNFKIKHLFTHIEGVSLVLLTVNSVILLIAGIFIPLLALLGVVGLINLIVVAALIKVEMELYEIKKLIKKDLSGNVKEIK